MKKNKVGKFFTIPVIISIVILVLVVICIFFGNLIKPYDETLIDVVNANKGITADHILGTDSMGRDNLSRLIMGCRTTVLNALMVVGFSVVFGVPLGMISGYFGKWFDMVYMRICDVLCAFPVLLLAFVLVAAFGRGTANVIIALGIIFTPMISKLSRSSVIVQKNQTYVQVAQVTGYSSAHIIFREILPNITGTLLAEITLDIGVAMGSLASMSYCGLGVQPPTADWGLMLDDNMSMIYVHPVLALMPGIAIILVVTSLTLLSDSVRVYRDGSQRVLPSIKSYKKKLAKSAG